MELRTVQEQILERLNRYRRLHGLITSDSFQKLFEASTEKEGALKCIDAGDLSALNVWVNRQRRMILEYMKVEDLRLECRLEAVPNYHLLQREEMIERLRIKRKDNPNDGVRT